MLLNKKITLFAIPFLFISCSQKVEHTLLLDHWSQKEKNVSIVERKLAAATEAECMRDTFTIDTLKAEISAIESKYKNEKKLSGSFEGLDYQDIPLTQGKFLATYGSSFGDKNKEEKIDYRGCSDVPCLLNKIYGQDSGIEGHAIYLWYLKTGHILAVDNYVYEQKSSRGGEYQGNKHPLKDYLFSKDELYGFWRLSHMISDSYKTLTTLKEIQRVPKGESFEGRSAMTCGLAWSSGWIQLTDSCLDFGYNNVDSGFFYESVTHEMAHEIDFQAGAKLGKSYRSQEPDWMEASGWELKEVRNAEGVTPQITRTLSIKPGFTKFVSSYAQTSPAENFADTLSLYLHNGDHTKATIPDSLYQIVKSGYYTQEEYTLDANINRIVENNYARVVKDILDMTVSCLEPDGSIKSSYFDKVKFQEKIPPLILNCMGAQAEILEKTIIARVKMTEPEGCNISKIKINGAKNLQAAWKMAVAKQIDEAYSKMKSDSQYLARIKEFYEKLSLDQDADKLYVACFGEVDEKLCFDNKLAEMADKKVSSLGANQTQHDEMVKLYVDSFQFEMIQSKVQLYYQNFLKGQVSVISEGGQQIWNQCLQVKADDKEAPTGTLFNIGTSYMVSSMYNCLNYGLPTQVKQIVRSLEIDGNKIQDGKEESILSKMIIPIIVSDLKAMFKDATDEEQLKIDEYIKANRESLEAGVKSNFSWATNYVDNSKIISDCQKSVLKDIGIDLYFHKKQDSMSGLLEGICTPIPKSPEFMKYLDSIRGELEGKSYQTVEDYVLAFAKVVAKDCLVKYPADTNLNRVKYRTERESCVTSQWDVIEKNAMGKLNAEPLVIKFKIDTSEYLVKLKARRRVLQLKTFKESFEK